MSQILLLLTVCAGMCILTPAGARSEDKTTLTNSSMIRLSGGLKTYEGQLEVNIDGSWAVACLENENDDLTKVAMAVCKIYEKRVLVKQFEFRYNDISSMRTVALDYGCIKNLNITCMKARNSSHCPNSSRLMTICCGDDQESHNFFDNENGWLGRCSTVHKWAPDSHPCFEDNMKIVPAGQVQLVETWPSAPLTAWTRTRMSAIFKGCTSEAKVANVTFHTSGLQSCMQTCYNQTAEAFAFKDSECACLGAPSEGICGDSAPWMTYHMIDSTCNSTNATIQMCVAVYKSDRRTELFLKDCDSVLPVLCHKNFTEDADCPAGGGNKGRREETEGYSPDDGEGLPEEGTGGGGGLGVEQYVMYSCIGVLFLGLFIVGSCVCRQRRKARYLERLREQPRPNSIANREYFHNEANGQEMQSLTEEEVYESIPDDDVSSFVAIPVVCPALPERNTLSARRKAEEQKLLIGDYTTPADAIADGVLLPGDVTEYSKTYDDRDLHGTLVPNPLHSNSEPNMLEIKCITYREGSGSGPDKAEVCATTTPTTTAKDVNENHCLTESDSVVPVPPSSSDSPETTCNKPSKYDSSNFTSDKPVPVKLAPDLVLSLGETPIGPTQDATTECPVSLLTDQTHGAETGAPLSASNPFGSNWTNHCGTGNSDENNCLGFMNGTHVNSPTNSVPAIQSTISTSSDFQDDRPMLPLPTKMPSRPSSQSSSSSSETVVSDYEDTTLPALQRLSSSGSGYEAAEILGHGAGGGVPFHARSRTSTGGDDDSEYEDTSVALVDGRPCVRLNQSNQGDCETSDYEDTSVVDGKIGVGKRNAKKSSGRKSEPCGSSPCGLQISEYVCAKLGIKIVPEDESNYIVTGPHSRKRSTRDKDYSYYNIVEGLSTPNGVRDLSTKTKDYHERSRPDHVGNGTAAAWEDKDHEYDRLDSVKRKSALHNDKVYDHISNVRKQEAALEPACEKFPFVPFEEARCARRYSL